MSKTRDKEMALTWIIEAVDRALNDYYSNNVDVIRNEETGMIDVIYHSDNNSFVIQANVSNPEHLSKNDKKTLIKELNKRHVGYCW